MRIISGTARGRRIEAPKGMSTRPTTDRVRESVFGILQFRLRDADVLDLFAGSGAMGLEALSRGARSAVLNDHDRESCRIVTANVNALGFAQRATVYNLDFLACLRRLAAQKGGFDLIFLDPPYGKGLETEAVRLIAELSLLKSGGRIVVEHAAALPLGLMTADTRRYGEICISFLEEAQLENLRISRDV